MQKLLTYAAAFTALILLQEFVLSHISVSSYLSVYLYIMVVILAHIETPGWIILLLGFTAGTIADQLEGTGGLFAATLTWAAFTRKTALQWSVGRDVIHNGGLPLSRRIGAKKFILYTTIMVLLWAIPFFLLEALGSFSLIVTPIRILASTTVTVILIYLLQLPLNRHSYNV